MLGKDSAAQTVPGLQRKGDFLQITLFLFVNNTKDEWWATGLYCNLLLLKGPHVILRAGQIGDLCDFYDTRLNTVRSQFSVSFSCVV